MPYRLNPVLLVLRHMHNVVAMTRSQITLKLFARVTRMRLSRVSRRKISGFVYLKNHHTVRIMASQVCIDRPTHVRISLAPGQWVMSDSVHRAPRRW